MTLNNSGGALLKHVFPGWKKKDEKEGTKDVKYFPENKLYTGHIKDAGEFDHHF